MESNTPKQFLNDIGLAPFHTMPDPEDKHIILDKGQVDTKSLGGRVVRTDAYINADGVLTDLTVKYWAVHPTGTIDKQNLIELETECDDKGSICIKSLYVMGREVNLRIQGAVENITEAIKQINVNLRTNPGNEIPDIANIFKTCLIEEMVGEPLPLPGFHAAGGLSFPVSANFNPVPKGNKHPALVFPEEVWHPLCGLRTNTLDGWMNNDVRGFLIARGTLPDNGTRFEANIIKTNTEKSGSVKFNQYKANLSTDEKKKQERTLARAEWVKKGETVRVKKLEALGRNTLAIGWQEAMGTIGVIADTQADMMRAGQYPNVLDHITRFNLAGLANTSSSAPPVESRFVLTSKGGNNIEEIYPGIGNDIGGNCKVVETQWLNPETMEMERIGAILDAGMFLIKMKAAWEAGHPDLVEELKYCKNIFITHHHLDHIDALIPYIRRGLLGREFTIHMTPEVHEMFHDKLNKAGVKKHDSRRPNVNFLKGTGILDIHDDNNTRRLTIVYGVDAVPHSAKDTPYIAYGREGDKILGSYMYMGDMRYDDTWFDIHPSEFWDYISLMKEREPGLDENDCLATYVEFDATSMKLEGRSVQEQEVEDTLREIATSWFPKKNLAIAMIGTNDGRRETLLRVANHSQRNIFADGKAVEDLFRIANKYGVNPYLVKRPPPGTYGGIEQFMQWHAEQNKIPARKFRTRTSQAVRSWLHEPPGRLMAVISGSQGTDIESESSSYKFSEGRSRFDANPNHLNTALPIKKEDWVFMFSQGAIPGNAKDQQKLIRRIASRGVTVLESIGDHLRIHNPGQNKRKLLSALRGTGQNYELEPHGTIVVHNAPIHASGHGRKEDMRLWTKKVKAKIFGLHHTDDRESVLAGYEMLTEEGKPHPGRIFDNFEQIQIKKDSVQSIGHIMPSVVLSRLERPPGVHYGGTLHAQRIITPHKKKSPLAKMGLRGQANGVFEAHFGIEEPKDVKKAVNQHFDGNIAMRGRFLKAVPRRREPSLPVTPIPEQCPPDFKLVI